MQAAPALSVLCVYIDVQWTRADFCLEQLTKLYRTMRRFNDFN